MISAKQNYLKEKPLDIFDHLITMAEGEIDSIIYGFCYLVMVFLCFVSSISINLFLTLIPLLVNKRCVMITYISGLVAEVFYGV